MNLESGVDFCDWFKYYDVAMEKDKNKINKKYKYGVRQSREDAAGFFLSPDSGLHIFFNLLGGRYSFLIQLNDLFI